MPQSNFSTPGPSLIDRFSGFVRQLSSSSANNNYPSASHHTQSHRHRSENNDINNQQPLYGNADYQRPTSLGIINPQTIIPPNTSNLEYGGDFEMLIISSYLKGIIHYNPSHNVLHGKTGGTMSKYSNPIERLQSRVMAAHSGPGDFKPSTNDYDSSSPAHSSHGSLSEPGDGCDLSFDHSIEYDISGVVMNPPPPLPPPLQTYPNPDPGIVVGSLCLNDPPWHCTNGRTRYRETLPPEFTTSLNNGTGVDVIRGSQSVDSIKYIDDLPACVESDSLESHPTYVERGGGHKSPSPDGTTRDTKQPPSLGTTLMEKVDWEACNDNAYGMSTSLYERCDGTNYCAGEPIADAFAVCVHPNAAILALADGVNWGQKSKVAARAAIQGATTYLRRTLFPGTGNQSGVQSTGGALPGISQYVRIYDWAGTHVAIDVLIVGFVIHEQQEVFGHLLKAMYAAHAEILKQEGGLTTLTLAVVCEMAPSKDIWLKTDPGGNKTSAEPRTQEAIPPSAGEYGVCVCNVGDSNAYVFDCQTGSVRELTEGSRDIHTMRNLRDAGGALGPFEGTKRPELNNLTCSQITGLRRGDIVFLTSDGVSDNMDPLVRKKADYPRPPTPGTTDHATSSNPVGERDREARITTTVNAVKGVGGGSGGVGGIWQNLFAPKYSPSSAPSVAPRPKSAIERGGPHNLPHVTALQRHELTLIHMSCVITDWAFYYDKLWPLIIKSYPTTDQNSRAIHQVVDTGRPRHASTAAAQRSSPPLPLRSPLDRSRPILRRAKSTPHPTKFHPGADEDTKYRSGNTDQGGASYRHDTLGDYLTDEVFATPTSDPGPGSFSTSARELCGRLLNYCTKVTEGKRRILEHPNLYKVRSLNDATSAIDNGNKHPGEGGGGDLDECSLHKEQKERRKRVRHKLSRAVGKLDHATVVAFRIEFPAPIIGSGDQMLEGFVGRSSRISKVVPAAIDTIDQYALRVYEAYETQL